MKRGWRNSRRIRAMSRGTFITVLVFSLWLGLGLGTISASASAGYRWYLIELPMWLVGGLIWMGVIWLRRLSRARR